MTFLMIGLVVVAAGALAMGLFGQYDAAIKRALSLLSEARRRGLRVSGQLGDAAVSIVIERLTAGDRATLKLALRPDYPVEWRMDRARAQGAPAEVVRRLLDDASWELIEEVGILEMEAHADQLEIVARANVNPHVMQQLIELAGRIRSRIVAAYGEVEAEVPLAIEGVYRGAPNDAARKRRRAELVDEVVGLREKLR